LAKPPNLCKLLDHLNLSSKENSISEQSDNKNDFSPVKSSKAEEFMKPKERKKSQFFHLKDQNNDEDSDASFEEVKEM